VDRPGAPYDALERRRRHASRAAWLEQASDEELLTLLSSSSPVVQLPGDAGSVFVKLVPLTAIELAHPGATANLFALPTYYQYRIGGCGFGAWRELEIHRLANEWVLSDQCAAFPLLHHWRILPVVSTAYDDKRDLRVWGDSAAIKQRVSGLDAATSSAVLFLEHLPRTLGAHLREQFSTVPDPAALVTELEARLDALLAFVHARGVLHMDAHFENILSDGDQIYLADYGLAMSRSFELSPAEEAFFATHETFDRCTAINSVVHALVTHYDARPDWRQTLRELVAGAQTVPDAVRAYLVRRAPLALAVGEFYRRLLADLTTPYPAAEFEALLAG
jgi:hypothetical protein